MLWKSLVMNTGTVKWFDPINGFGFVQPDNGGQDVSSKLRRRARGLRTTVEGQKLGYDMVRDNKRGKMSVDQLQASRGSVRVNAWPFVSMDQGDR